MLFIFRALNVIFREGYICFKSFDQFRLILRKTLQHFVIVTSLEREEDANELNDSIID
jgi:hypothetical protein